MRLKLSRRQLLHDSFLISISLKGLNGLAEVIGGVTLFFVSPQQMQRLIEILTQHELRQDPNDWLANQLLRGGEHITAGGISFAAVYLLAHGIPKLAAVAALLKGKLWAYPFSLAVLGGFIVYQLYYLATKPGIGMVLLTGFDILVVVLIWLEYRAKRRERERPAA
ncbi:MAG: DUF2127 domain-containing protein [Candidatus Chaera renei]|uniref:DUF2127 domain-containing protein n=1 Tax=Candidatus Chaera renei TaxID=2506947 RepID=A0A4Q0AIM2_9BACT|nr:MAG: DUF2127 domain-containing protein [Candidatus Chaera renei]